MTKTMKIFHGLVILAILGFAFYWFQWRPSNIRKKCIEGAEFTPSAFNLLDDKTKYQIINDYYQICIKSFGLEK
jgi:hypothetical protein